MKAPLFVLALLCFIGIGCSAPKHHTAAAHTSSLATPDEVLAELKAGNKRFLNDLLHNTHYKQQIEATKTDQHPHSVILSCLDSRIPPESIFDQGIGNIFVARVAGNIENTDILGSMEFATKAKGSKLIVVMGHNACGAVKGAVENVQLGNLSSLLNEIKPAIQMAKQKTSNPSVDEVTHANVQQTIQDILSKSSVIKALVDQGKVKIVGAFYDLTTGRVSFDA